MKVSVDDKLTVGAVLAEKKSTSSEKIIHVAQVLNISAKDLTKSLKKHLGDGILKGDLIAEKKGGFGKGSKKIISEFSGIIIKINQDSGDLILKQSGGGESVETLVSPVEGTVDFCNNEKIVIKTDKDAILAQDGIGEEAEAEIVYLEEAEEEDLSKTIEEKVLLIKVIDRVAIFKAIGLDVAGIVAEELEEMDFVDLTDKKISIPIMIVNEEDFKKLVKLNGKKVYLGGKDKNIVVL